MPAGDRKRVYKLGPYDRPHIEHNLHIGHSTNTIKTKNNRSNYHNKSLDCITSLVGKQSRRKCNYNEHSKYNSSQRFQVKNGDDKYRNPTWNINKSCTGWYTIIIPNAYDCDEILKKIATYLYPVIFYPYNIFNTMNDLKFFVDNYDTAKKLHFASYKIKLRNNQKFKIKVYEYFPKHQTISYRPVSSIIKEKIVEAMSTRYDPNTKSLDLSRFYACIFFTDNKLFVPLNRPSVLLATLNIAAKYTKHELYRLSLENNHIYLKEGLVWIRRLFPRLKFLDLSGNKLTELKVLNKLSGYSIEVLNLSNNPVCSTKNKEKFVLDVLQLFPMLNKLDNLELPCRQSTIVKTKLYMPINLDNSYPISEGHNPEQPNPLLTSVELFITQFYNIYDNKVSRQMVSEAYHENATFSLSSCFLSNFSKGSLAHYKPISRNLLISSRFGRSEKCVIYKGKKKIISVLEKLPKTRHDLDSFFIDVPIANSAMIQIVVNGVFAENLTETCSRPVLRSFCRTFTIVPIESSWYILSDLMFVTMVSYELLIESSKRFYYFNHKNISPVTDIVSYNKIQMAVCKEKIDKFSCIKASCTKNLDSPLSLPLSPQKQPPCENSPLESERKISVPLMPVEHETTQKVVMNSMKDTKSCSESKLTMVKRFSSESGMYPEWAKKCLEENDWDYTKASLCFLKLKPNIPAVAYIR